MSAAFNEAYSQEKKESRSVASNPVLRHFFLRKLQRKVALGIAVATGLLMLFGTLLLLLP